MEDMVFLCTVENAAEALIVKSLLDEFEIRYRIDTHALNTYGYFGDFNSGFGVPVGSISFYVHKDDFNEAKELLSTDVTDSPTSDNN